MLNLFPIQFLSLLAYFILRSITGITLLLLGCRHLKNGSALVPFFSTLPLRLGKTSVALLIFTELTAGTLITLGLYTQLGAILLIILSIKMLIWRNRLQHPTIPSRLTYFLLLGIGMSLLITGAGVFAFDLPI